MMMVVKDEWVRAAMTDDRVVVELLVRLKQAQAAPPTPKSAVTALKWGIRQPRSRSLTMRCDGSNKKDGDSNISTRGSPTTPLSWSGGGGAASPSTIDCFEETSRHVHHSPPATDSRSKGAAASETTSTTTKRSRRKKTFAELKEEESLLLKERINLKKEMETMLATFKEHRAENENLKRMKLDLNLQSANDSSLTVNEHDQATSSQHHQRVASSHAFDDKSGSDSCKAEKDVSNEGSSFILPDLNMLPFEDDSGPVTYYGTS